MPRSKRRSVSALQLSDILHEPDVRKSRPFPCSPGPKLAKVRTDQSQTYKSHSLQLVNLLIRHARIRVPVALAHHRGDGRGAGDIALGHRGPVEVAREEGGSVEGSQTGLG